MVPYARSFLLSVLACGALFAQSAVPQFYTVEKEVALGRKLAGETRKRTTPLENAVVQEYVNRIAKRLTAQVSMPLSWSFEVVSGLRVNPTHEPLEFPGGFLFIPRDLVLAARDEEEFAGMLAHSIAHVVNRDVTRAASGGQLTNQGTIPLVFVGGWQDGLALPKAYWPQARSFENAADQEAVGIMKHAGYDPHALVRYIARVQPDSAPRDAPYPGRDTRVSALEAAIQGTGDNEFAKVQEQVRDRAGAAAVRKPPSLYQ